MDQEKVQLDPQFVPPPTEGPEPPPDSGPGFLSRVNPLLLWILAPLLLAAALFILWFYIPSRKTDVMKRGIKADGSVVMKDSHMAGDGRVLYSVIFVYADDHRINHSVKNYLYDSSVWNDLAPNKSVKVFYLPENPD